MNLPRSDSVKRALILLAASTLPLGAQVRQTGYTAGALTPHQQLTREIYKQIIEINSGDKTGSVTPVALALAQRFRDAGIPDSDIFVGGPRPDKHNVVARISARA